jgi:hypothetical protein
MLLPQETTLKEKRRWQRYVNDSLLAFGSICLLTSAIFLFHLSFKIPDSLLLYLLIILALASTRGSYAALLAAFAAFFSFDFFFVPPLYSLVVTKELPRCPLILVSFPSKRTKEFWEYSAYSLPLTRNFLLTPTAWERIMEHLLLRLSFSVCFSNRQ